MKNEEAKASIEEFIADSIEALEGETTEVRKAEIEAAIAEGRRQLNAIIRAGVDVDEEQEAGETASIEGVTPPAGRGDLDNSQRIS